MTFDPYEYFAIILPGSVVVLAAVFLFPEVRDVLGADGIDLGGLGVFLVGSFVVGHVVQALGNLLEWIIRRLRWETYSEQLLSPSQTFVAPSQRERLEQALRTGLAVELSSLTSDSWRSVHREMYAHVRSLQTVARIDLFNRNYGMHRGIAAGFIVAAVMTAIVQPDRWLIALALFLGAAVSLFRMRRFAGLYLRELIIEFIRSPPTR